MIATAQAMKGASLGARFGAVAEWLRSGLQSRVHRFDSGPRLGSVERCTTVVVRARYPGCTPKPAASAFNPEGAYPSESPWRRLDLRPHTQAIPNVCGVRAGPPPRAGAGDWT